MKKERKKLNNTKLEICWPHKTPRDEGDQDDSEAIV
jgi:hypothetical protein